MTLFSMFLDNNSVSHTVKTNENGLFVNRENRESYENKKAATKRYRLNNSNWTFVMLLSSSALWHYRDLQL